MPDEIVIRFSVADDGSPVIERVNKKLGETEQHTKSLAPGLESARQKLTGFVSANAGLITVLTGVGLATKKLIDDTVAYGDELEKVKRLTGLSAEESSKLVQVADDLFISQESLNQALTIGGKQYDVSINGLAKLADQYNALQTTTEKNDFAAKHFGRSYSEVVKLLEVGGDKLKAMGANIHAGQIFSDADLVSLKIYKQEMDELSDTIQSIKLTAGKGLIGLITGSTAEINASAQAIFKAQNGIAFSGRGASEEQMKLWQAAVKVAEGEYAAAHGIDTATDSTNNLVESQKEAEAHAKRLSDIYNGLLTSMFNIQSEMDNYGQAVNDANAKDQDLGEQKAKLTEEFEKERAKIEGTTAAYDQQHKGKKNLIDRENEHHDAVEKVNDAYQTYMDKMNDLNKAQQENADSVVKAKADLKKASDQRVVDLVKERLGADGIIDSGEFEYLQKLYVSKGLVSQAAADQAIAESKSADTIVQGFTKVQGPMETTLAVMQAIRQNAGLVSFGVDFTSNLPGINPTSTGGGGFHPGHADGGQFMIPAAYGNEGFRMGNRDTASGGELVTITPRGGKPPGATNNFTINIGSIRSQQDLDYLAQEITRLQVAH